MLRKFQCFMCGYIEERELGDGKRQEGETPQPTENGLDAPTIKERGVACPKCGESKWVILQADPKNEVNLTPILTIWDSITTVLSGLVIPWLLFWKRTEIYQTILLTRIIAFLGIVIGTYLLIRWFNCGFDRAAIFMILFYTLCKWK